MPHPISWAVLFEKLDDIFARLEKQGEQQQALFAELELSAFRAQVAIAPLILDAANHAFEVGGASATLSSRRFDRHWRNARVLANHNPLIYRSRLIGNSLLNDDHEAIQYTVGAVSG